MPDKLTGKEVVKALEDTLHRIKGAEHLIVPKEGIENLCNGLENALDLINRLQAKVEELELELADTKRDLRIVLDNSISAKLPHCVLCGKGAILTRSLKDYDELIADISAEAYKEFAERLKERKYLDETGWSHGEHPYIVEEDDIDDVLEELVGD